MTDPDPPEDEDVDDDDTPIAEDGDDDDDDGPQPEAAPPVQAGPTRVAVSSDGSTTNVLRPQTSIVVTVRRDFPLRAGERLGEWRWSSADGQTRQDPQRWELDDDTATPAEDVELGCEDDRAIFGWGIGYPQLGSPGDSARQFTTDRTDPIAATVRLRDPDDQVVAEGTTRGRDGACRLATEGRTGTYTVEVSPEHATEDHAGPGMHSDHPLLYRAASVQLDLRGGRIVAVDDPYDPPNGTTHVRVGNRKIWAPTTTQLPITLKPEWWRDPLARRRRGGTSTVDVLVLHCTGGSRMGPAFNRFFRNRGAGANYLVDIDGHAIKLVADDRMKVHAGGRWGGAGRMPHRSFGIEIINPNAGGETPYMARAQPPYTEEQYATLVRLCGEIVAAYPNIGPRIVGHCDVATGPIMISRRTAAGQTERVATEDVPNDSYGRKRNWDPGPHFEWERLTAAGLGMVPVEVFDATTHYGGIFAQAPELALDQGDQDAARRRPARYGGQPWPNEADPLTVVRDLQRDLSDIGYSLHVNGEFDAHMFAAVDRFRRHFEHAGMGGAIRGRIDLALARSICNAAHGVRGAQP